MHCHSTNSDGANSPSTVATAYKNQGYAFLSISDHCPNEGSTSLTADPGVSGITFIVGCEACVSEGAYDSEIILLDLATFRRAGSFNELLEYYQANVSSLCHPTTSAIDIRIAMSLPFFRCLEIYNKSHAENNEALWDQMLSKGRLVYGTSNDDCHDTGGANFNKAWIVVKAASSAKADILSAMAAGNFYASTGNDISITYSDGVITAQSTASSNFEFIGKDGTIYKTENGVTSSNYTPTGAERYIRVRSKKAADTSQVAWSQPIVLS